MNKAFTFMLAGPEKVLFEAYKQSLGDASVKECVMKLLTTAARDTAPPGVVRLEAMYEDRETKDRFIWSAHFDYGEFHIKCVSVMMEKKDKKVRIDLPFRIMFDKDGVKWKIPAWSLETRDKHKALIESMRREAVKYFKKQGIL